MLVAPAKLDGAEPQLQERMSEVKMIRPHLDRPATRRRLIDGTRLRSPACEIRARAMAVGARAEVWHSHTQGRGLSVCGSIGRSQVFSAQKEFPSARGWEQIAFCVFGLVSFVAS